MCARSIVALAALASLPLAARAQQSVLLFERDADAPFAAALRVELSVAGLALDRVPAAVAADPDARAALASTRGALAAIWIQDEPSSIVVAFANGGAIRRTPLSADGADARVRALVAASLIDELLSPMQDAELLDAQIPEPAASDGPPPPPLGYRLVGRFVEEALEHRPLLSFYGQLTSGVGARVHEQGSDAPLAIRLEAGWADRADNRLGLVGQLLVDAFEPSMATAILFGLSSGARFTLGALALHAGATLLGGSATMPRDQAMQRAAAQAGAYVALGVRLGDRVDVLLRFDLALWLRQETPPGATGTLALGLDWHG